MGYKMAELKRARDIVAEKMRIPSGDAAQVIGYYNGGFGAPAPDTDKIGAILAGDVSAVPAACKALGITTGGATGSRETAPGDNKPGVNTGDGSRDAEKPAGGVKPVKDIKTREAAPAASEGKKASKKAVKNKDTAPAGGVHAQAVQDSKMDIIPAAEAEVVQDDELPPGFGDRCAEWVEAFCAKHEIDSKHIKAQQWRSACMYVGENIKHTGVYRDRERERHEGGIIYSGKKLEKLLALWAYLCGTYNQVPLVSDFVNFSGVSRGFFYDYEGRGLSSTSVQLVQKARKIEEAGLGSSVAGGGAGAVGGMFLLKARHNYSETVTIQHTSSTTALGVAELPLLEAKKP